MNIYIHIFLGAIHVRIIIRLHVLGKRQKQFGIANKRKRAHPGQQLTELFPLLLPCDTLIERMLRIWHER